ncbi:TauD/TfdA family dioxygenase [Rhizobium sp. FKY42]|uniref:TauD/TfdA family dioxygenase n=1 Tax=Rhizobium sp. FKY42 TaxID=2562310 RepID=UPI0010BF789F|nr:TauD/TfdA family dioxygenase [Rhizobium sp. FKY42]
MTSLPCPHHHASLSAFRKLDRPLPSNIAWAAEHGAAPSHTVRFSPEVLGELRTNRSLLQEEIPLEGLSLENSDFPCLRETAAMLQRKYLQAGSGFVIVTGLAEVLDSQTELENTFWRLCLELGRPFVQKSGFVRFGRVENLGRPLQERPRYHETGTGGSIHTDSPIMPAVADYVGLLCVRPALSGGDSKFISVGRIHNILLEHAPDLLDELYQPFYFDRRLKPDEISAHNPATLYEPIFSYDPALGDHGLRLRWQPEYVWQAPQLPNVPPLTERQHLALHLLEGLLEDRTGALTIKAGMQAGDIQLLNNHVIAHGRTAFEDHVRSDDPTAIDPDRRRLMRRVWLHAHA